MAWKNESRRHSLARKGIRTNIDDGRRFDVSNFVAKGKGRYTYHGRKLELGELLQDGYKSGNDYFLIIQLQDGFIIGGYIDLDEYWKDAEYINEIIVEPMIFTVEEFDERPMEQLSSGWDLRTKEGKEYLNRHIKKIEDLLKDSRDFETKARYEIINKTDYAKDVAIAYNQNYDNVKHTKWFMNAVETELESDFKSEQRWKELKQMEKKKASGKHLSVRKFNGEEYYYTGIMDSESKERLEATAKVMGRGKPFKIVRLKDGYHLYAKKKVM